MRILITGAAGFTARYLDSLLRKDANNELYYNDISKVARDNWIVCDLIDYNSVQDMIEMIRPEYIYHLAGSFSNDYETDYKINVITTKNLLESILKLGLKSRVLLVGSSAEYGMVLEKENPINEEHALNPVSIYGLTKVYQTYLMKYYVNVKDMDVVIARTFNLLGKGATDRLFIGRLHKQIEEYKKGNIKKIVLGNLNHKRDYINIKEAVIYYEVIIKYGKPGEIYNVGSGKSILIGELLENILRDNGLTKDIVEAEISYKNSNNRKNVKDIYADINKLINLTNSFASKLTLKLQRNLV